MFEYVVHEVYFNRKGEIKEKGIIEIVDTLEEALSTQRYLEEYNLMNNKKHYGYYIEHRIKLDGGLTRKSI